jgi:hypothetical protein
MRDRALPRASDAPEERPAWHGIICESPQTRSPLLALGHHASRDNNEMLSAQEQPEILPDGAGPLMAPSALDGVRRRWARRPGTRAPQR